MLIILSQKNFQKNHQLSSKINFFWKRDDFRHGLLRAPARNQAHLKENNSFYKKNVMSTCRRTPLYIKKAKTNFFPIFLVKFFFFSRFSRIHQRAPRQAWSHLKEHKISFQNKFILNGQSPPLCEKNLENQIFYDIFVQFFNFVVFFLEYDPEFI